MFFEESMRLNKEGMPEYLLTVWVKGGERNEMVFATSSERNQFCREAISDLKKLVVESEKDKS